MRNKILNALPFILLGGWVLWLTKSGLGGEYLQSLARGEHSWWIWIQMFAPMIVLVLFILPVVVMGGMAGLYEFYKSIFYDIASLIAKLFKDPEKRAEWIGKSGECIINAFLLNLPQRDYHVEHDLLLRTADDRTVQIDHMVISRHGVFVLETKLYNCEIYGTGKDFKWTLKYGKKTYSVQNPVRQNEGHIKALQTITGLNESAFFNIVVLVGNMKFKKKLSDDRFKGGWDTKRFIRKQKKLLFSHAQKGKIIDAIEKARDTSETAKHKHNNQLRERHLDKSGRARPSVTHQNEGEDSIESFFANLPSQEYHIERSLPMLATSDKTGTVHVIFSRHGVFIIDIKSGGGYIFGKEQESTWTQMLSGRKKHILQNPLRQNDQYIKILQTITGLPEDVFLKVVVFADNAVIKRKLPENVCAGAGKLKEFIGKQQKTRLSNEELRAAIGAIRATQKTFTNAEQTESSRIH